MILLNLTPCERCKYCRGIKKKSKEEKSEYIHCVKAKDFNAKSLLTIESDELLCEKFKEDE